MKFKDESPIKFEIFQSNMETIMYQLNNILKGNIDKRQIELIRNDFQHKIECHKKRKEWI